MTSIVRANSSPYCSGNARKLFSWLCILAVTTIVRSNAADTLPAQLSDAAYWKMISDFSEPDGVYAFQVVTSNETAYQQILPELTKSIAPGGVYFGVGPEQNFTYIAALRPKIAF